MRVKVKFLRPMMKSGKMRKAGDELEIDATAAANLAMKGIVEVPGYKVEKVKREVEVNTLQPNK
jgi:hypothetical protein